MRKFYGIILAATLLATAPALAGNLTFENGQTEWHSTQCPKPGVPPSIRDAHSDTPGDDMNSLAAQHNAFVDAAQVYMNCVSAEAQRDQDQSSQTIASGAQKAINDMQDLVNQDASTVRSKR